MTLYGSVSDCCAWQLTSGSGSYLPYAEEVGIIRHSGLFQCLPYHPFSSHGMCGQEGLVMGPWPREGEHIKLLGS